MATTHPLRVLMLHHDPAGGHGGASHMAWRTADALAGRGHEVALAGTVPPAGRRPAGDEAGTRPDGNGGNGTRRRAGDDRTEAGRARRLGDRLPRNDRTEAARARRLGDRLPRNLAEAASG